MVRAIRRLILTSEDGLRLGVTAVLKAAEVRDSRQAQAASRPLELEGTRTGQFAEG